MEMKENDFICPACKGHLNVDGHVVFSTKTRKKNIGLILLNPDVGTYSYKTHPRYSFKDGEMVDFYCPICHADLKARQNESYAGITMIDEANLQYEVLFSRKAGEKSTYIVADDNVDMFGEDAIDFDDLMA